MGLFPSGIDTRPHRGFTEPWLGTRWAPSNPFVARGQGRFGHRQAAVAIASGEASVSNQIWWLVANPIGWIADDSLPSV
jgi:hypothetical protein